MRTSAAGSTWVCAALMVTIALPLGSRALAAECLYSTNLSTKSLDVIKGDRVGARVMLGTTFPQDVTVLDGKAFVSMLGEKVTEDPGSVAIVDLETSSVVGSYATGRLPSDIESIDGKVYTANLNESFITVYDASTGETSRLGDFDSPVRLAVDTLNDKLLVGARSGAIYAYNHGTGSPELFQAAPLSAIASDGLQILVAGEFTVSGIPYVGTDQWTVEGTGISNNLLVYDRTVYSGTSLTGRIVGVDLTTKAVSSYVVDDDIRVEYDIQDLTDLDGALYVVGGSGLYRSDPVRQSSALLIVDAYYRITKAPCPVEVSSTETPTATSTASPTRTQSPSSTRTASPTSTRSSTATPTRSPTATASHSATPTATIQSAASGGGCHMNDQGGSVVTLLVAPLLFWRRRRAVVVAATAGALMLARSASADLVPGKIVIKFSDDLNACAHCLLEQGQSFASALSDGSTDLDYVNQSVGVTGGAEVFFARHGMDTTTAKQALQTEIDVARNLHPELTERVPVGSPPPDLGAVNIYEFSIPVDANPYDACGMYL